MVRPLLALLAALSTAATAVAQAPETPPAAAPAAPKLREKQLITMDFQDVEIGVLVKFISEITGRNFILDEKVRGKVTVVSPTKITIDEAYRVFQSILEVKGFTTVPAGPVVKIVPVRQAKEGGAPVSPEEAAGDQYITQLLPLSFVDASSLVPILQPMVSKDGLISSHDPTNTLILIDSASNIQRLIRVVSELDVEVPERGIEFIKLENAYAEEVAATLQEVLEVSAEGGAGARPPTTPRRRTTTAGAATTQAGRTEGAAFRVIPDVRTNSLIVLAGGPQMRTIKSLVKELDKKLEGISKINVIRLKYANAVEMVEVLSQLIGGGTGAGGGLERLGGGGTPSSRRTTRESLSQQRSLRSSQLTRNQLGQQLAGALGGAGGGPGGGAAGPVSASGSGGEFVGEVRVTADPYTNSLIISAAPQDHEVLRRVIEDIDIPRRQVLVEAIILEVSLDKARELGIELQGGVPLDDGLALGRTNFKNLNPALTNPGSLSGMLAAAVSNQTITLPDGTVVPAQAALLTALQSDTDVNILSAPTILTSDNQEAEILVGQNIPFIASRATDSTNLANTFATVERQDVGITLRLTPQISQGDVVRLDLYEEVSAVVPNPPVDPNIAGPTTTVRSASTTVVARNGQTVSLGGLISDASNNSESKIPFIGDIPVLGHFFKSENNTRNKVNLLIFLTPHIVYGEEDLTRISLDRRDRFERSIEGHEGPNRRRQLRDPSWNPPPAAPILTPLPQPHAALPPPAPTPAPAAPAPAPRAARPAPPPMPTPAFEPVPPPSALGIPETGHQFAVLLALYEKGTPPPELETSNGFLTIYFPDAYATYFEKGGNYEYATPRFEGKYTCLEVFTDAREALSVYPEGERLERWQGALVRWKPFLTEQMQRITAGLSPWKRIR